MCTGSCRVSGRNTELRTSWRRVPREVHHTTRQGFLKKKTSHDITQRTKTPECLLSLQKTSQECGGRIHEAQATSAAACFRVVPHNCDILVLYWYIEMPCLNSCKAFAVTNLFLFSRALLLARSDSTSHSTMSSVQLSVCGRTPLY